jgi:hypothetical protein
MKIRPAALNSFRYPGKKPLPISLLSIFFLFLSLFYLLKSFQAGMQWNTLESLTMSVSPLYLLLDGFLRGCSAGILSWSLWTGKSWARIAGKIISLALVAATWIDLIFIAEPIRVSTRWPFNLVLTLIGLPGLWLILSRKEVRAYFSGNPVKIP